MKKSFLLSSDFTNVMPENFHGGKTGDKIKRMKKKNLRGRFPEARMSDEGLACEGDRILKWHAKISRGGQKHKDSDVTLIIFKKSKAKCNVNPLLFLKRGEIFRIK